jgi:hypothetical protein
MTSSKENKRPSNIKKIAIIATCFLFSVIVAVIVIKRYQPTPASIRQQTSPAVKSTTSDSGTHQLREADRQFLIEKGLHDPINDLVRDLMKHNELIPCEGVLGGTPGFYNPDGIKVLSKDYVIAEFDDGHIEGYIELTFKVSNGTISWTVIQSECGD